jgi:hypothetical protein
MKRFLLILAMATMATPIILISTPVQAFTWDDLWRAVKRGYDNAPSLNSSQQSFGSDNNESPQSGGFNNDAQQPQSSPINAAPQQNSSNSNQSIQPNRPNSQGLRFKCINANGNNPEKIDRDSSDSNISVGRKLLRVVAKSYIGRDSSERTCRILQHPSSGKMRAAFAIADNSNLTRARVTIFVDGQEKMSRVLLAGQARQYTFDISGANSFAIVIKSLDGGDYVYALPVRQPL